MKHTVRHDQRRTSRHVAHPTRMNGPQPRTVHVEQFHVGAVARSMHHPSVFSGGTIRQISVCHHHRRPVFRGHDASHQTFGRGNGGMVNTHGGSHTHSMHHGSFFRINVFNVHVGGRHRTTTHHRHHGTRHRTGLGHTSVVELRMAFLFNTEKPTPLTGLH